MVGGVDHDGLLQLTASPPGPAAAGPRSRPGWRRSRSTRAAGSASCPAGGAGPGARRGWRSAPRTPPGARSGRRRSGGGAPGRRPSARRGRPPPGELAQGGDGAVGGGVHAVAGRAHLGPGAVVEDGLEGPRDQLRDVRGLPEVGEAPARLRGHRTVAVLPPRQVPLAHVAGLVALPGQAGGQRRRSGARPNPLRQTPWLVAYCPLRRQARAGAQTGWLVMGQQEARPLPRQAVEVRGEAHGAAVDPQGVPALLVGEDDQDIGSGVSCSRHSSGW